MSVKYHENGVPKYPVTWSELFRECERLQRAMNELCEIGRKSINLQDKVIEMRSLAVRHERKFEK